MPVRRAAVRRDARRRKVELGRGGEVRRARVPNGGHGKRHVMSPLKLEPRYLEFYNISSLPCVLQNITVKDEIICMTDTS